jgi:hypothetical protein
MQEHPCIGLRVMISAHNEKIVVIVVYPTLCRRGDRPVRPLCFLFGFE